MTALESRVVIGASDTRALASAVTKARRRLVPFLFVLYIVAYLDRINVGFAALQMNTALGFSATTYGFGAGIFFVSYVLFEIPSNLILARVGARVWIARIMISWGIVSASMMFVRTAQAFYVLRFLLGAAEAGFFPGLIYYLTCWFPPRERASTVALFMTAIQAAGVVGGPLSGALLSLDAAGLAGWQWLFLIEGVPAIVLGIVVLAVLTERPRDAAWLTPAEKAALAAAVDAPGHSAAAGDIALSEVIRDGRTWLLAAVYFTIPLMLYGLGFWMPQLLKATAGTGDFGTGLLTTIPYAAGAAAMVLVGRRSDRVGERRWHIATAAAVAGASLSMAAGATSLAWTLPALSLAMAGHASMSGPFWALATDQGGGSRAAASIALINSVGNIGGFVGPYLLGAIEDAAHSIAAGLYAIAALMVAGGALALAVHPGKPAVHRNSARR